MAQINEKIKAFEDAFDAEPAPNVRAFWAAEEYAAAGLKVFPLRADKVPCVEGWKERGTTDAKQLEKWFLNSNFSKRAVMVGMHCGSNGLVALDADKKPNKEDGVENLRNLYAELRIDPATQFPNLPITLSPSGSEHHIYKQPFEGGRIGCSRGKLPSQIDVKGDGGYVALPGSVRKDGVYTTASAASLIESFQRGSIPYLPQSLARIIGTRRNGADGVGAYEPLLPDELVERILDALPNDTDYFGSRDRWIEFGFSVFAASAGQAREAWVDWCATWEGGGDPDKDAAFWDTINSGDVRAQLGEIKAALEHFGLDDIAHDVRIFEAANAFDDDVIDDLDDAETEDATEPEQGIDGVVFDGDAPPAPERMLVKGLVPYDGIAFLGGQSGGGKTFIGVDLSVSLTSGEPFFGRKVCERVGVVYLAAEGGGTINNRVHVARNAKAHGEILPIAWLKAPPDFSSHKELRAFAKKLRAIGAKMQRTHGVRLGAVIIDTLAAAFGLDDENSNSEAARAINLMNSLSRALGVVVIPVHHYGKDEQTGLRGASAWLGGADVVLSVTGDRKRSTGEITNRRLALAKTRSGEAGEIAGFDLQFVRIGIDEDGEEYGACYVRPTPGAQREERAGAPKMNRAACAYLTSLENTLRAKGAMARPFGADGPEVFAVDREDVRAEFYAGWLADGDSNEKKTAAKRKAFNRGEADLSAAGAIGMRESKTAPLVWLGTGPAGTGTCGTRRGPL